ncbi:MAG TPA: segregation/condensation protein A [Terracidiphilus sp.]|nr:segregation/condensation protein A [Terracidiphilus sp.]
MIAADAAGSVEIDATVDDANAVAPEFELAEESAVEPTVWAATEAVGVIGAAPESVEAGIADQTADQGESGGEPGIEEVSASSEISIETAGRGVVESESSSEDAAPMEVAPELVEPSGEGSSIAGIETVNEEVMVQATEQPAAVEYDSVDEATPEAETPVNVEPFPEPADQPMDLINPISEKTVEQDASAEASDATKEAAAHDREPEAAGVVESAAAAGEPVEDASEPAAAIEEPSHLHGEDTAEPASEIAPEVSAPVANPISTQAGSASGTEPAAASVQKAAAQQHPSKPFIKLESRDNEADLSAFSVVVSQVYDGPLDLLLDLIRRQDIDIYDIPIARITAQFLAYVNQLKATDVDVAGEFIYTASLLIHIKSKMLLPRAPAGPDDAAEDPRRELVERLLEHERFKNAAQMLQQKQMLEAASWTNPGIREFQDYASAEPEIAADTVDLVRVFRDILDRARNRPVINVEEDSVTVGQMIQFLARRLTMEDKPVALRRLLSHTRSERALIAMFLALLELVRLQAILLRQDRAFSEIFVKKHTGFEAVMDEGMANARDDWR